MVNWRISELANQRERVSCLLHPASCLLLVVILAACYAPSAAPSPNAVLWLDAHALLVERVGVVGMADFGEREVVRLPGGADALALLATLDAARPDYVLAGKGVAWDGVRAQPWFIARYHPVAVWRDALATQTLFAYTPSPFDAGERISVTARFATEAVVLRAYRLSQTRIMPGEPLYLTLYWDEADAPTVTADFGDLMSEVQLIAAHSSEVWAHARARLQPTGLTWDSAARLAAVYTLALPSDLPVGEYVLSVNLTTRNGAPVLTTEGAHQSAAGQNTARLPLTSLTHPPTLSRAPLTMDYAASAEDVMHYALGDAITLLGYDAPTRTAPGYNARVSLYWHTETSLPVNYKVFVHIVSAAGAVVAQDDAVPVQWTYPTTAWQPGDYVRDDHTISLPHDLPRGDYVISVGMYDAATGDRLPVTDAADARVLLGMLRVR